MTPGSVAPRTVHSVRPGSTTTWPTCRDVTLSHNTSLISFQLFLVILQALSLSCQSHQTSYTTKYKSHMQRNCNALSHAAQSLTPISLTLTTTVRNSIAYIYHISHTVMGCRYFNLAMTCGICPRYGHASHKSASAFRFPDLWGGHGTSLWCLADSHSDEHLQATAKAIPRERA